MKIFVDSAKLDDIKQARSYGMLDGVTTNPSLIKQAVEETKGGDIEEYIKNILLVAEGTPVSLEVVGSTYDDMVKEGKKLYELFNPVAGNVVVKIPVNPAFEENAENSFDGIRAIRELSNSGTPVNTTLIFTPEQALLAAKAGAKMVSPFAGRIDDYLRKQVSLSFEKSDYFPASGWEMEQNVLEDNGIVSGIDLVEQCVAILSSYNLQTEVLAASLRNPRQVREAALAGADIATLPLSVIKDLLSHYKTREGMAKFTQDVVAEYADLIKGK
ncbi:transaldolase family protein [Acidobacteriota bacterium]